MGDIERKGDQEFRLVDKINQYSARVNSAGRILVSQEVSAPADTTPVKQVALSDINSDADTIYTITDTKTLTVQRFGAGSEHSTVGGSKVTLYSDPNGNLTGMVLIGVIYINGCSSQIDVDLDFVGDGTRRIVMRRSTFAGAAREVFGTWTGFEA